jgi:hypothetical protein
MTFRKWIEKTLPGLELVPWQWAWVDAQDRGEAAPLPTHPGADYVRRLYAQYMAQGGAVEVTTSAQCRKEAS